MSVLPDIRAFIDRKFRSEDRALAAELVESAVLHDGSAASPRCQRAALVAAEGAIHELKHFVSLLKIDFRDVILAGEYEFEAGNLRHARDLNQPFKLEQD